MAAIYPSVYLDAIHLKLRREDKVVNTAVYVVLGGDLEDQREVLGHGVGDGAEGANTVEGYYRQLRKVTKSKGAFPTAM